MSWLVTVLDKYEPQVRADFFQYYGQDLTVLARARRWHVIYQLIDELPEKSRTVAAIFNDDDLWNGRDIPKPTAVTPPLTEWGMAEGLLASLVDAVNQLIEVTVKIAGGKPARVKPVPRPETAVDRARAERSKQGQLDLIDRLTPGK